MEKNKKLFIIFAVFAFFILSFIFWKILDYKSIWFYQLTQPLENYPSPSLQLKKEISIIVSSPEPDQKISSPLKVSGIAKGGWFFEAGFPVRLLDTEGNLLASASARAQGEWMTENFVPFEAELIFDSKGKSNDRGFLILERANPSNLPENSEQISVPVEF